MELTEDEILWADRVLQEEEDINKGRSYLMEVLIVFMLATMALIYFAKRFYVVVPAGHKGALFSPFRGGTQLDGVYFEEGFGLKFPWDKVILYDTRILEHQDTIAALTEDGLDVIAEISYRYFPDYHRIGYLHREIGPDYLESILVPHLTSITRDVISHYRIDKLYSTSRDSIQIDMTNRSQNHITDNYPISIVDVVVRNIVLPDKVKNAIAEKLVKEQKMLEYVFELELEEQETKRKLIEARGIKLFRDTSSLDILQWEGIKATKELAKSSNAKVIVIGTDSKDLPIILGGN